MMHIVYSHFYKFAQIGCFGSIDDDTVDCIVLAVNKIANFIDPGIEQGKFFRRYSATKR